MKKTELVQLIETIVRKQLNEDFKNETIKKFFGLIKSSIKPLSAGHTPYLRDLRYVKWSEIPEDDRIKIVNFGDIGSIIRDKNYYIFWINLERKIAKYAPPTYTRYGIKLDNNKYSSKGLVGISRGSEFQKLEHDNSRNDVFKAVEDSYDKPHGIGSVKRVSEVADLALCIPVDIIETYNAKPLQKSRSESRSGAVSLQDLEQIKRDNIRRYKDILKNNKITQKTKEYDVKYKELLSRFLTIYMALSQNVDSFDSIIDFDKKIGKVKDLFKEFATNYKYVLEYTKEVEENPDRNWYKDTLEKTITSFNENYNKLKMQLLDLE